MIEIYQPLRILTAEEYQLRNRQSILHYNSIYSLYVDRQHLIPFTVRRIKTVTDEASYYEDINFTTIEVQSILNNKTYNILPNLSFDYQVRGDDSLDKGYKYDYAIYRGDSTITTLPQGLYQIYFKDEDNNEFYSEVFRIWIPSHTVKFEYRNSVDFNDLCFYDDLYWKMQFESVTYSTGEFQEFLSVVQDDEYHDKPTYRRKDEIWSVHIWADTLLLGSLHLMQLCDTISFTNESGRQYNIEITEIVTNDTTEGGHADIDIKYRILNNTLKSIKQIFTYHGGVDGENPRSKPKGLYLHGKKYKLHGKILKK